MATNYWAVRPRGDWTVHCKEYRHGARLLVSGIHMKKLGIIVYVYNARNGKVKTGGFLGLTGQAGLMEELQVKRWMVFLRKTFMAAFSTPHSCTCSYIYTNATK